jgi:hypothetical protein
MVNFNFWNCANEAIDFVKKNWIFCFAVSFVGTIAVYACGFIVGAIAGPLAKLFYGISGLSTEYSQTALIASFMLNASSTMLTLVVQWFIGLYLFLGWYGTYNQYKNGVKPTFDLFIKSCLEATPLLWTFAWTHFISQIIALFFFSFHILLIGLYLVFMSPGLVDIFSNSFVTQSESLIPAVMTRFSEWSPSSLDYMAGIFYLFFFVLTVEILFCFSLLVNPVIVFERRDASTNIIRAFQLFKKEPVNFCIGFFGFGIASFVFVLFTCGLGYFLAVPAASILPLVIYTKLKAQESNVTV